MKCLFCGFEFKTDEGVRRCRICSWAKGCERICCPRCGYEALPEPEWISRLVAWIKSWRNK